MTRTIMAVGAHADDVEIYCGGTLLKYRDQGYNVLYVQSTNNMSGAKRLVQPDGSITSTYVPVDETIVFRKAECEDAAALFGTTPIHLDHPQRHYRDQNGDEQEVRFGSARPEIVPPDVPTILTAHEDAECVQRVTDLILEHDPEVIFTHGFSESNLEHSATTLLVIKGYWQAVEAGYEGSLLAAVNRFSQLGSFHCRWETWTEVEGYVDRRMAAIQTHVSQYPPEFTHGAEYWREILEARGRASGGRAAEVFNFVDNPSEAAGPLMEELLAHRATQGESWGLA